MSKHNLETSFNPEISNNIGEQLKVANLTSKTGTKVSKLREKLDEARVILDTLDVADTVEVAKEKVKGILNKLYGGHNLEKQYGYLSRKRSTMDVVTQAYNVVASKEESYSKQRETLEDELAGI